VNYCWKREAEVLLQSPPGELDMMFTPKHRFGIFFIICMTTNAA
jgi:hypothetical protein